MIFKNYSKYLIDSVNIEDKCCNQSNFVYTNVNNLYEIYIIKIIAKFL